jgi:hypothetical protein
MSRSGCRQSTRERVIAIVAAHFERTPDEITAAMTLADDLAWSAAEPAAADPCAIAHQPLWTSLHAGYCVRCRTPLTCEAIEA